MDTSVSPHPVSIYALRDPRTDEVRYIGRTTDPKRRMAEHHARREIQRPNHRGRWIKSLLAAGVRPLMCVLEVTTAELWPERERHYVAAYRAAGARLTNATDGGDGCLNVIIRPETRLKLARNRKGKPFTPEQRARLSAAHTGKSWTEAQRVNYSRARKGNPGRVWTEEQRLAASKARQGRPGRPWTDEQRHALAAKRKGMPPAPQTVSAVVAAHKGKPLSDEQRAKIAASLTGRVRSPEHCAAVAAAKRGRKGHLHSAETRAKMSAAHMGHKDRRTLS